ncbi:hypothetical protein EON65_28230 [archaeon]|nr:MAG: hypothetical protein EON65_28230 [archaeon]
MSESVGKRQRKTRVAFEPEDFTAKKQRKGSTQASDRPVSTSKKARNEAVAGSTNKWKVYYNLIKRAADLVVREEHFIEVRIQTGGNNIEDENKKSAEKILEAKKGILRTFQAISEENQDHVCWPQLAQGDEEDMIDVGEIMCSKCQGEEVEGNDILLCDRAGCLRAYHQLCLEPAIDLEKMDMEKDWFCWQCECIDDCMDYVGERLGKQHMNAYIPYTPNTIHHTPYTVHYISYTM